MRRKKHFFTLVELIVSMAVFALMGMMVVQLFSASQKLWVSNSQKNEIAAEGRMALDAIANLLMSATSNPFYDTTRVGSDYFVLNQSGPRIGDGTATSRLYFITKSDAKALVGTPNLPACFAGIQVVQINGSDDPDDGCYVLVVGVKTEGANDYAARFPDNTATGGGLNLVAFFESEKAAAFKDIVDNTTHKVSRIASNVVDFQVRAFLSSSDILNNNGKTTVSMSNNGQATDVKPDAVEIELTLMDRRHYLDFMNYVDSGDHSKANDLRDQYGRTFRRMVWLDGSSRPEDISGNWEE